MSGGNEFNEAPLWRRWREGQAEAGDAAAEPDALTLAAYAEGRLGRQDGDPETDPAVAAVEAWLAEHPEALTDLAAARLALDEIADPALIARASALIAQPHGNVVTLRQARRPMWQDAMAWSGIAATLLAAVLIGFQLGNDNVVDLSDSSVSVEQQAPIGSPNAFFATDDEDGGI